MNSVLRNNRALPPTRHRRRGLTIVEVLVALAIASVFLVSVMTSFVQILRASEESEATSNAHEQARSALLYLSRDTSAVRRDASAPVQTLILEDRTFAYGDGIDNDNNGGAPDTMVFNGWDSANAWGPGDDRHATINGRRERPDFVLRPDLGDVRVGTDTKFGNDRLTLRIPPDPVSGDTRDELITYEIGSFDGEDHVLLRTVVTAPASASPSTVSEPVAFNVLGFDVLAWNPNADSIYPPATSIPFWTTSWNAAFKVFPLTKPFNAPDGTPPLEFPASLYFRVQVYSGRIPLANLNWTPGSPIETVSESTLTDLEVTLRDLRYERFLR